MLACYLSFLSLGEPASAPAEARLGQPLSESQLAAVASLEASTAWWSPSASVAADELGRGTGRAARTTLDAISRLTKAAVAYSDQNNKYSEHSNTATPSELRRGTDTGAFVVGSMKTFVAGPLTPVVASRIDILGNPQSIRGPYYPDRQRRCTTDLRLFV